jgi:hypothetical protein
MSFVTLNWALKLAMPPRSASAKAVLIVLAYRAKRTPADRFECYPSIPYLVGATGQNRKTIFNNLAKLQRWRLLSDTGRRMGKTRQVIVYRLHMREGLSTPYPQKPSKPAETGPKSCANSPKKPAQVAQKRDTDSFSIDAVDKGFCAAAREKTGVGAVTGAPEGAACGGRQARVQAHLDEIARVLRMPGTTTTHPSRAGAADETSEGGAA